MGHLIKTAQRMGQLAGAAVLIFLTAMPAAWLVGHSLLYLIRALPGNPASLAPAPDRLPAWRLLLAVNEPLLLRSLGLGLAAAALAGLLGLLTALAAWTGLRHPDSRAVGILFLLLLIPPFIHVQAWIICLDNLLAWLRQWSAGSPGSWFASLVSHWLGSGSGRLVSFGGSPAVIWTQGLAWLPLTAGFCLLALIRVPWELAELCQLETDSRRTFRTVYLPAMAPLLGLASLLVFVFQIMDYGVASVFGVPVLALELFARYSAGDPLEAVGLAAWPLLLAGALSLAGLAWLARQPDWSATAAPGGANPFRSAPWLRSLAVLGTAVFVVFLAVPAFSLVREAGLAGNRQILATIAAGLPELGYSLVNSALAAGLGLGPALAFALLAVRSRPGVRAVLLTAVALPLLLPAPVTGLALISLWNQEPLVPVYHSAVMPAVALIARYGLIEVVVLTLAIIRLDPDLIAAMDLEGPALLARIGLMSQLLARESLAAVLIVFTLDMGEFGATLLVTPPGYQTLSIKIYNYLHYGASDVVATLCLTLLAVVLAAIAGAGWLWRRSAGRGVPRAVRPGNRPGRRP